jgi:hypothetical protein
VNAGAQKYWAFISYSHGDAKVAAELQRALETYRIPRRLVGGATPLGPVPPYLKPVFRDREEMQASADLGAIVREALAQSRFLIVVCSPAAAKSAWVNREIIEFKRMHGESRVLALIVSGEPFASAMAGREAEECFPEALRFALTAEGLPRGEPLEPMAADLRPQGDGKRRAILKLIAGMLGSSVGVDELVRRDLQRRTRRLAAVSAASVAGMAVMAVLTVMAVRARTDAQVQRAQAEDLLEFMLGDLRKKLDPVGRLDVLDSVGEKALGYYAKQEAGTLDADSLGRRSRALHLIGEIREQRGKLDEASAAFAGAAQTTAQLLARAPGDGKRIFDHAQSVYWVGYVARLRGQLDEAEKAFVQYRQLALQLVRIDAANIDWQLEAPFASQNLGVVRLEGDRPAEALQSFSEARDGFSGLTAMRPALAFELADAHGWIAKVLETSGDYGAAIDEHRARLAIFDSMPDAGKDARVRRNAANARHSLARLKLILGDAVAAEPDARAAVEQAEALVAMDASNLYWLSEACFNRLRLAEVELALGRREAAMKLVERVGADAARLIASDASRLLWTVNLLGFQLALKAQIEAADGRRPPGREIEAYLATVRELQSKGTRFNRVQGDLIAAAELVAGDILDREGKREPARERWEGAAGRLQSQSSTENYHALTLLARARLRLGETAAARTLAARVEASKYRHPAYAGLVNELAQAGRAGQPTTATRRN